MSWYGDRDHKTYVCDYCGDEVDADNKLVMATWRGDGVVDFCSDECANEACIHDLPCSRLRGGAK